MSQEPIMRLQTPDARARRQAIREQLIVKIENLSDQNEQLDKEIEELGFGKFLTAKVKNLFGKEDKKSDFDETKHPRGEDGRFAKVSAVTEKVYSEKEYKKWSETIDMMDAEIKELRDERDKAKNDPNRRPLSNAYLDKMVDFDKKIKSAAKKRKRVYDYGPEQDSPGKNRAVLPR